MSRHGASSKARYPTSGSIRSWSSDAEDPHRGPNGNRYLSVKVRASDLRMRRHEANAKIDVRKQVRDAFVNDRGCEKCGYRVQNCATILQPKGDGRIVRLCSASAEVGTARARPERAAKQPALYLGCVQQVATPPVTGPGSSTFSVAQPCSSSETPVPSGRSYRRRSAVVPRVRSGRADARHAALCRAAAVIIQICMHGSERRAHSCRARLRRPERGTLKRSRSCSRKTSGRPH